MSIRTLFTTPSLRLRSDEVKSLVERKLLEISDSIKGKYSVSLDELGVHGTIEVDTTLVLDVRVCSEMTEVYLGVRSEDDLKILERIGFNDIHELLRSWKVRGLPICISISKVAPSKTLYIILCGDYLGQVFPNIKVFVRNGEVVEASASYCRVAKDEDICGVISSLSNHALKLWKEFFRNES